MRVLQLRGDKKAALAALASERVAHRDLVSKNVTHGIVWDAALQARLLAAPGLSPGTVLAREGMALYLSHRPEGKLLHDPLAACAVLDRDAFTWAPVEVTYGRGQWGARPAAGSGTFISIAVDWPRAADVLFGTGSS